MNGYEDTKGLVEIHRRSYWTSYLLHIPDDYLSVLVLTSATLVEFNENENLFKMFTERVRIR